MPQYSGLAIWIDSDNDTYKQTFELVAADEDAALAELQTLIEAENVLTDAALHSMALQQAVDTSAWTVKTVATANSDVEIQGRIIFRTDGSPRQYKNVTIPAFKKNATGYVTNKIINLGQTDILAFVAQMNSGGFTTSHYEDLVASVKGYEVFNGKP